MIVKEIYVKTILSKSKVSDYTINPYVGCEHACTYCYARFMKRFTGHKENWGQFLDVKTNAPDLLSHEVKRKRMGRVWISGVCDPYQPIEKRLQLTRRCLEILLKYEWPVTIQTKSSLVLRDIDLIKQFNDIRVGLSITTSDEKIKEIFEPNVPSINDRIETLKQLHFHGIETFAMIAPLLPKADELIHRLDCQTNNVLVDRMNYHYADEVYNTHKLTYFTTENFFLQKKTEMIKLFNKRKMKFQFLY